MCSCNLEWYCRAGGGLTTRVSGRESTEASSEDSRGQEGEMLHSYLLPHLFGLKCHTSPSHWHTTKTGLGPPTLSPALQGGWLEPVWWGVGRDKGMGVLV